MSWRSLQLSPMTSEKEETDSAGQVWMLEEGLEEMLPEQSERHHWCVEISARISSLPQTRSDDYLRI